MRSLVCLTLVLCLLGGRGDAAERVVYLINIGWHTGIAISVADVDRSLIPEAADLPTARWIEFGWGDAEFYLDPNPSIGQYLAAAFEETPAVMHLVGIPAPPEVYFPKAEVVVVPLDAGQIARLQAFISASFERGGASRAPRLGRGLYATSAFYDAHGVFTLDNTCNTWVARAFAAAGLEIDPEGVRRASTVTALVREAVLRQRGERR